MSRRRLGAGSLLWRHATAGVGASAIVAIVIVVVAALAVGVPRAVQLLATDSIQHQVDSLPVTARDVVAEGFGGPQIEPSVDPAGSPFPADVDSVWGGLEDGLGDVREQLPPAVARSLGEVAYAVTLQPNRALADWDGAPDAEISLGFDPRILEHVTIVDGTAPEPMTRSVPNTSPTEIMLSDVIATRMAWEIGEVRELNTPDGRQPLVLSATFAPTDEDEPYWQHIPASLRPSIEIIGLAPPVVIGVGFAHPSSWSQVVPFSAGARMHVWFPVMAETLNASTAGAFASGIREFIRSEHPVGQLANEEEWFGRYTMLPVTELSFSTGINRAIDDAIAATSAASAVLAMMASGPIGVVVAVLILGTRLIVDSRTPGLRLASARGASRRQLRAALIAEGIGLGVPAVVLGAVIAAVLVPGNGGAAEALLPAVVAVLPAVLLASAPSATGMRRVRTDVGSRSAGSWRWTAELIVVATAALAVFLLLRRGFTSAGGAVGVDPLLAAVPLLLSLAACVMVMRLYPLPLGAIASRARSRRGLVAFLGSIRGLRDPASGLAPILAMVVGVSVAVFSGTMLSTVSAGIDESARAAVGADLLVSSQAITAAQAEAITEVPGVESTAPVYAEVRVTVTFGGDRDYLAVVVIDAAELAQVQYGDAGAITGLDRLRRAGERIPVIASEAVAETLGDAQDVEIDGTAVDIVGTGPSDGPVSDRREWVIVDRANAEKLIGTIYSPSRVFVDLRADAAPPTVRDGVADIVQGSATVSIPADVAAQLRSNPVASGLQAALIAALLVISFLCAIAIVMTLARGNASRGRLLAMLRTLGLRRADSSALIAWELAPMTIIALIAGTALGLSLPAVVLAGVDLTLFTGGTQQPSVMIDPLLTAVVTGGFLLLVIAATVAAVIASGRIDAARALRTIEE